MPRGTATTVTQSSALAPWPHYADDEIAAVTRVLKSGQVNYWTGEEGRAFEAEYAAHCDTPYALAVANGTVALELALHGLGIGAGDEVVVPARTFVATASAVVQCGAVPIVADVDPISQNITADTLAAALSPRTKAVIPVHLNGWPVDMTPFTGFARDNGLKVIEDCAQSHGATSDGRTVGGIGDIGCFSFCQDKIISTAGEGGMIVTSDEAAYRRMWSRRDHGKDFDRTHESENGGGFRWLVDSFGGNGRLTEAQSAIGRLQLKKLPRWMVQRRANASILTETLGKLNAIRVPQPSPDASHAYYRFSCFLAVDALKSGWTQDRICAELRARGVPAMAGACPDISREAAFKNAGFIAQPTHPNAARIADATLALPVHPTLTLANMAFLADTTREVVANAVR